MHKDTDKELANKLLDFIIESEWLLQCIDNGSFEDLIIRSRYSVLRDEIRKENRRIDTIRYQRNASEFALNYYIPSINEASAYGFTERNKGRVADSMFRAIEEGNYKLTKYIDQEELEEMLSDDL